MTHVLAPRAVGNTSGRRRSGTCSFIWLTSDPSRLSASAAKALENESELGLSDACVWELCLKWQSKKIQLPAPPRVWVSEQVGAWSLLRVPIVPEHLYRSLVRKPLGQ